MARTADHISEGLLVLGIWPALDAHRPTPTRYGTKPRRRRQPLDDLAAALQPASGTAGQTNPAHPAYPPWIGGAGEKKTLRLVAHTPTSGTASPTPRPIPGKADRMRSTGTARAGGRDPATVERSSGGGPRRRHPGRQCQLWPGWADPDDRRLRRPGLMTWVRRGAGSVGATRAQFRRSTAAVLTARFHGTPQRLGRTMSEVQSQVTAWLPICNACWPG